MTPESLASKLLRAARQHPPGAVRYHRASGQRLIVMEYCVDVGGCVMLQMDDGRVWSKQLPAALSETRIHDGDGEHWKNGEADTAP